ncbi:unnamed protein product [Darwinula stevensoni]|uniref:CARD domain-containing protein n=1 Tax=Darwinula stevensoni TaxID=69355 RepID=A0A7R8XF04_9CRUS|nr:unnamed protein product [Darwinula stevensoni]CAG0894501.1 unnamed protein product [Darwinula stevensoni]
MTTHSQAISNVLAEYKNTFQWHTELEDILLCLKTKGIIHDDEYHEMVEETRERRKKQTLFLLRVIPTRGDNAFPALLQCLMEKYSDLVQALLTSLESRDRPYAMELRRRFQEVDSSSQPCQRQPGSYSAETVTERPRKDEDARGRAAGNAQGRSVILSTPISVGITSNPRGPPDAYKMSANPRGKALVISNSDFHGSMNDRPGTDIDAVKIRYLFEKLHFSVDVEEDLTRQVSRCGCP